ncbi:hypothetical protein HMPREF1980_00691, partial [Actinomyces sp. oral taxon 172 str. F0311]
MQYLRCLLPYASKVAPQPAQVWVVMARRSSIIGWVWGCAQVVDGL